MKIKMKTRLYVLGVVYPVTQLDIKKRNSGIHRPKHYTAEICYIWGYIIVQ